MTNPTISFRFIFLIQFISVCVISQETIDIHVDFDKGHVLRKGVYGLNNNIISRPYYMSNSGFQEKYNDLGQPTMRYPGGTVSNYLDLSTGWAEYWPNCNGKDSTRVERTNIGLNNAGKGATGQDINQYIDFLMETGGSSNFISNITNMSDAEAAIVLQIISDAGADIPYFEIGNELYFKQYDTAILDGPDYLMKAESRATVIKQYFPNAKIGILCPSQIWSKEVFLPGGGTTGKREDDWYVALTDLVDDGFFDALVIHMYFTTGMANDVAQVDWIPVEEAYTFGLSQIDGKAEEVFDRIKTDFNDKTLWVTEYNVGGFSDSLSNYPLRNRYLGGLETANFMMKLFKNKIVEVSSWHSLVQMLLFQDQNTLLPDDYEFMTTQNYEFFKFFKEPVLNSKRYRPVTISGGESYLGKGDFENLYPELEAVTFHNQMTNTGHVVLINKKEKSYQVNTADFELNISGKIESVKALNPDSSMPVQTAILSQTAYDLGTVTELNGHYLIKPYSLYSFEYSYDPFGDNCPQELSVNNAEIYEGEYTATDKISATGQVVMQTVDFVAGQEVSLLSGFEVQNSSTFHAFISPCQ